MSTIQLLRTSRNSTEIAGEPTIHGHSQTAVLRSGARRLLAQAIEAEAETFLAAMKGVDFRMAVTQFAEKLSSGAAAYLTLCRRRGHGVEVMRGADRQSGKLFSYISPEAMVPPAHPLGVIRPLVNTALDRLAGEFEKLYSPIGRPSIAPEKLLRALLLQAFFSVRSERQLMEQLTYNILFRWFVGLSMDAPVWDVTVFTKNRDRLLEGDIARTFLLAVLADPKIAPLLSDEHFSVDRTLIEA